MSNEKLEHELHLLSGKQVTVVRPGFGTQSDSWGGIINSVTEDWPIKFLFVSIGNQIIFRVEDVVKIEFSGGMNVIRLKGPHDYVSQYEYN